MPSASAKAICALLERNGFEFIRQKGSHRIYVHPDEKRRVTVPVHPGDLKAGTLRQILKQAGLTPEDL